MKLTLRRIAYPGCRRRTLASLTFMTLVLMMFLSYKQPHEKGNFVSHQRRSIKLDEANTEHQMPPELKRQEDELLLRLKNGASGSINKDKKSGKPGGPAAPEPKKEKPPVKEPIKETVPKAVKEKAAAVPDKDKTAVETKVEEPIKIVNLFPETKEINITKEYPPHLHPDRFKFIYVKDQLSTVGPKVNLIPEQMTWRHDLDHMTVCNSTDPLILAIIVSAVPKRELRDYIRRTWANPRLYPYTKIRSVFIIGATPDAALQKEVDREYAKYSDLIQYNFIDSYGNLTYKSLAWLTWVGKNCPQAQFIAKIDDDVMVNPFHLRTYFEEQLLDPPNPESNKDQPYYPDDNVATTFIYGRYDRFPYPLRYTKWAVTKEEYPEGQYPPFVHGPAYVVGRTAATLMRVYAPYVPFLKLEDVYTTGLLAHAAQVKHVQINGVINTFRASSKLYNGTQALMEETNPKSRQEAWEGISLYAPVDINALGTPWS